MENIQNIKKNIMYCIFTFACLTGGCFENRLLYMFGMMTGILLVIYAWKERNSEPDWSAYFIFIVGLPLCALLSLITAVDRGMDILGILRIFAICCAGMVLLKLTGEEREHLLMILPEAAGITLAVSYILWFIPAFRNMVFSSHRLAGCFGYANTYALFLLLGCIVLFRQKDKKLLVRLLLGLWLVSGILLTGSKTIMCLAVAWAAVHAAGLFFGKKRKSTVMIATVITFIGVLVGAGWLALSFGSSTFWGRLLYWKDMLPVIVTHPFGTGYLGFYYMQSAIQTGVYDTSFLHNSILQLASDYGWGAIFLFLFLAGSSILYKKTTTLQKELLAIMLLHFMFDFDLEYLPIWIVFFLSTLPLDDGKVVSVQKKSGKRTGNIVWKPVTISFYSVLSVLFLYFCVVEWIHAGGNTELARRLYSWNTEWNLEQMANMESVETAVPLAEKIAKQNAYSFLTCEVKALAYAGDGEWEQAVDWQTEAVYNSKYRLEGYETLLTYLQQAALTAVQENDEEQAGIYIRQMKMIPEQLKDVKNHTSWLGWKITEQPELSLEPKVIDYLNRL